MLSQYTYHSNINLPDHYTAWLYFVQSAIRLYIYQGLDNEKAPEDVTHVIVDSIVTVIKEEAFDGCEYLVSVVMGDNVKIIEWRAFCLCTALRIIRLSKTLEYIEMGAFCFCESLEALFLPSTVDYIESEAFMYCHSLRLIILPSDIDLSNVDSSIIQYTGIHRIAEIAGVAYGLGDDAWGNIGVTEESNRQMNEWLVHHMDEAPFHKICYNSSVTTRKMIDYLNENGTDAVLAFDPYHDMTPLHMFSMNPHAPADAIASLFNSNTKTVFCADNQQKTPLEYARDYNVGGLIQLINVLCNHRNSSLLLVEPDNTNNENATKRRKLENSNNTDWLIQARLFKFLFLYLDTSEYEVDQLIEWIYWRLSEEVRGITLISTKRIVRVSALRNLFFEYMWSSPI